MVLGGYSTWQQQKQEAKQQRLHKTSASSLVFVASDALSWSCNLLAAYGQ
jgi:hypothetical protein